MARREKDLPQDGGERRRCGVRGVELQSPQSQLPRVIRQRVTRISTLQSVHADAFKGLPHFWILVALRNFFLSVHEQRHKHAGRQSRLLLQCHRCCNRVVARTDGVHVHTHTPRAFGNRGHSDLVLVLVPVAVNAVGTDKLQFTALFRGEQRAER